MSLDLHNIQSQPRIGWTDRQLILTALEIERFWLKVERVGLKGQCWLWLAGVSGTGSVKHGNFTVIRHGKQRQVKAHRIAWMLENGPIAEGLCVCHRCDVGLCCNPAHLFIGTQQENLNDARRKGRLVDGVGAQKLSREAYREILLTSARGCDLARKYGTSEHSISRIRAGKQGRRMAELVFGER